MSLRDDVLGILFHRPDTVRGMAAALRVPSAFPVRSVCKALRRERMVAYRGKDAYGDKAMQLTAIGRARLAAARK